MIKTLQPKAELEQKHIRVNARHPHSVVISIPKFPLNYQSRRIQKQKIPNKSHPGNLLFKNNLFNFHRFAVKELEEISHPP